MKLAVAQLIFLAAVIYLSPGPQFFGFSKRETKIKITQLPNPKEAQIGQDLCKSHNKLKAQQQQQQQTCELGCVCATGQDHRHS